MISTQLQFTQALLSVLASFSLLFWFPVGKRSHRSRFQLQETAVTPNRVPANSTDVEQILWREMFRHLVNTNMLQSDISLEISTNFTLANVRTPPQTAITGLEVFICDWCIESIRCNVIVGR